MCGVFGLVTNSFNIDSQTDRLKGALNLLGHRGPDNVGTYIKKNIFIGHRRLSIIDIKNGSQPMTSNDNRYIITFNGEIFNFKKIRIDLEKKGYDFQTKSDTEVILGAFSIYGYSCLNMFNGMFAFAIWDKKEKKLFIARDRFGIKPLFYHIYHDGIIFSSEKKSIYATGFLSFKPKSCHFNEFLIFGYIAGEETLHNEIYELESGNFLTWQKNKTLKQQYWRPQVKSKYQKDEVLDITETKIRKSVNSWLNSDVEVASLLSGGIDSNLLTTLADKQINGIRAFSAILSDDLINNEKDLIRIARKKLFSEHKMIDVKDTYLEENFFKLIEHYDDPIHDANYYSLMAICSKIREMSNIKVVLCGEGADEIFGGYERYRKFAENYTSGDLESLLYSYNHVAIPRLKLLSNDPIILSKVRYDILDEVMTDDIFNTLLYLDQKTFLGSYLHRQDRVGMMYGLEIRTPFLDHNLVEFVNSLPSKLKYNNNYRKLLLRMIGEKFIDHRIVWHQSKIAFTFPINHLLRSGFLNKLYQGILKEGLELEQFYFPDGIIKLLEENKSGVDHSNTLWRILCLEFWLRYMKKYN